MILLPRTLFSSLAGGVIPRKQPYVGKYQNQEARPQGPR